MVEVKKFWFHKLPGKLKGDVVIVDACAASANMCILLSKRPQCLIVVNERNLEKAENIYKSAILVGESERLPSHRFVASNNLDDMRKVKVRDKKVLWMSINGSRVVEKVMEMKNKKGEEAVAGSFSNMQAISSYFSRKRGRVNIVMAGNRGVEVEEDKICGEIIERMILGLSFDWEQAREKIKKFVKRYYGVWRRNLKFLVDYPNEFDVVPKFFINKSGFIEVK